MARKRVRKSVGGLIQSGVTAVLDKVMDDPLAKDPTVVKRKPAPRGYSASAAGQNLAGAIQKRDADADAIVRDTPEAKKTGGTVGKKGAVCSNCGRSYCAC